MAVKVNLVLSPAQAEALGKILAAVPKQTKTVEVLSAKLKSAQEAILD